MANIHLSDLEQCVDSKDWVGRLHQWIPKWRHNSHAVVVGIVMMILRLMMKSDKEIDLLSISFAEVTGMVLSSFTTRILLQMLWRWKVDGLSRRLPPVTNTLRILLPKHRLFGVMEFRRSWCCLTVMVGLGASLTLWYCYHRRSSITHHPSSNSRYYCILARQRTYERYANRTDVTEFPSSSPSSRRSWMNP